MEESKLLKISWKIYAAAVIVGIVISVVNIISPMDYFCSDWYEAYTGQSWSELIVEQPKHAALYEHWSRSENSVWVWGCLYALYITLTGYRKGEKRALMILLLATTLATGSPLVLYFVTTGKVDPFFLFWLCFCLIVLLLPVKEIWGPKAAQ